MTPAAGTRHDEFLAHRHTLAVRLLAVRHATDEALDELEPLLRDLRGLGDLTEKKRGTFYRRSKAFLHFHEDLAGLFADVRLDGDAFERVRVSTAVERKDLLRRIRAVV